MFLNNLLEVSGHTTDIITYITIGVLALLAVIVAAVCIGNRKKKFDTKSLAFAAICLATSFVLSFIKITPVPSGGSITLASWVPVLIYAYAYGAPKGFLVGIIFGLLNFISGPYILTPFTFILDYILAFAMVGLMGLARKFNRSLLTNVVLGTVIAVVARFVMHLISGMIYFAEDAIWVDLPTPNAFVYSLIYQLVYIPGDAVICLAVLIILAKSNVLQTLLHIMRPNEFSAAVNAKTDNRDAAISAQAPADKEETKNSDLPAETAVSATADEKGKE